MSISSKRKILLMGRQASGKSTMRGMVFGDKRVSEVLHLLPTLGLETAQMHILGNFTLGVWECGGQEKFMESYFKSQKEFIFYRTHSLIYVLDVAGNEQEFVKDLHYLQECMQALDAQRPVVAERPRVFVLLHKMDLLQTRQNWQTVLSHKCQRMERMALEMRLPTEIMCTSIWDESLYRAWCKIVQGALPNAQPLEEAIGKLRKILDAREVAVLEKNTFLLLASAREEKAAADDNEERHEHFSNVIKQFKISCQRWGGTVVQNAEITRHGSTVLIEPFTAHTYILVRLVGRRTYPAAVQMNLKVARPYFDRIFVTSA